MIAVLIYSRFNCTYLSSFLDLFLSLILKTCSFHSPILVGFAFPSKLTISVSVIPVSLLGKSGISVITSGNVQEMKKRATRPIMSGDICREKSILEFKKSSFEMMAAVNVFNYKIKIFDSKILCRNFYSKNIMIITG